MLTSTCTVVPSVLTSTRAMTEHTYDLPTAKEDDVNDDARQTAHSAPDGSSTGDGDARRGAARGSTSTRLRGGRHHHHPEPRLRRRGVRGLGNEPRLVRECDGRLPRRAA